MRNPLARYKAKRNFKETPEPDANKPEDTKGKLRFVIHKHEASHLHYDLRLEIDGVLVSWAVPKGLPTEANDKNLAMHVEDHPYAYKDFEGTIPEGNYGAGTVMIWDEGYYDHVLTKDPEEIQKKIKEKMKEKGEFKFVLHGKKLKGEYAIFRFPKAGEEAWLVLKHDDEYAGREIPDEDKSARSGLTMKEIAQGKAEEAKLDELKKEKPPSNVSPMLALPTPSLSTGSNWIYELKWDGYRIIASKHGKDLKLSSRNGKDYTEKFPDIAKELSKIDRDFVLDGEIVVNDEKGVSRFGLLQQYLSGENTKPPLYYAFDLLHWEGHSLQDLELRERLSLLKQHLKETPSIKLSVSSSNLESMVQFAKHHGLEGVLAKDLTSTYEQGERSGAWEKLKLIKEEEFVVVGYIPKGEEFKSLALARYEDGELKYCGQMGTGFTKEANRHLLRKLITMHNGAVVSGLPKDVQPIQPELIAQVHFTEMTEDGMLRHPAFAGWREDKVIEEMQKESRKTDNKKYDFPIEVSNPGKIYFPELGLTKGDVVKFYDDISEYILPYLKGRPVSMHRHPNGIHGESFFQKDYEQNHPDWVHTIDIPRDEPSKEKDGSVDAEITAIVCDNKKTLLYMANLGVIEIHPWYSRVMGSLTEKPTRTEHKQFLEDLEKPDFLLFDLDPGNKTSPAQLQEAALMVHDYLEQLNVKHMIKTSGSKGLHIYAPLGRKYSFEQAKDFVKLVGVNLIAKNPELLTIERDPDNRRDKIYVDYAQNRHRHTTVSVYSLRPNGHAGVSTPLTWEEVAKSSFSVKEFNYYTILPRLKKTGDMWKGVLGTGIDLREALERMSENSKEQ